MENCNITKPEFLDSEKTIIRFLLNKEDGSSSVAQFKVPEGEQKGVNPFWDKICEEYDVEELKKDTDIRIQEYKEFQEYKNKKTKAEAENRELRILFDLKAKSFDLPFIADADSSIKSAIRRSPDILTLNAIIAYNFQKYLESNNISCLEYIESVEESNIDD